MKLTVELWHMSDTRRGYLTDAELTTKTPYINWARPEEATSEEYQLTEKEENLGIALFAISAVAGAVLAPKSLEVFVEDATQWPNAEPAILSALAQHVGADEVSTFLSPQNLD